MKRTFFALLSLLLAVPSSATQWHTFGARSMGMGGAGVALPQGGVSAYWNPALLGLSDNASGLQFPVSLHAAIMGPMVQGANDLNHISQDCQSVPLGPTCSQANINAALATMGTPNSGALADAGGGVDFKLKGLTVFFNDLTYVGGTPKVDNSPAHTTALAFATNQNQSRITLRGISAAELGVGYGLELPFLKGLLVGGNLKLISAKVGYNDYYLAHSSEGSSDSGGLSKFASGAKRSANMGVDVGLLWDIGSTYDWVPMHPRIGVSGRNVNNPKFSQPDQAKTAGEPNQYSLQGQARAGAAISPLKLWNIVADVDLTHNLTPVDGVVSQILSVGTEVNVFNRTWLNIPLRAGVSRNVAMTGTKTSVSAGLGLNWLHVVFDAAATATPSSQTVQTQGKTTKIPGEFGFAGGLAILFGGSK